MAAQWLIPILGLELKKYTVERDGQDPTRKPFPLLQLFALTVFSSLHTRRCLGS